MQANWSLILNVLLLTGVVIALVRMLKAKKSDEATVRAVTSTPPQPLVMGLAEKPSDEVIAVRKITRETPAIQPQFTPNASASRSSLNTRFQGSFGVVAPPPGLVQEPKITPTEIQPVALSAEQTPNIGVVSEEKELKQTKGNVGRTLMIFLLAKENRQLAGYELLQTILAAGLRFGEGHLFHRHQHPNGQGPVLCSLATATSSGVFDLQNIGAFSVHGLCLFMETSGNAAIDIERLAVMIDTAKQLSEGLDTHMLDETRKSWSDESASRYEALLAEDVLDTVVSVE